MSNESAFNLLITYIVRTLLEDLIPSGKKINVNLQEVLINLRFIEKLTLICCFLGLYFSD